MIESANVSKQQVKFSYVNGEYDLFDFTALVILRCPQNSTPPYNRITVTRRQGLKAKAIP